MYLRSTKYSVLLIAMCLFTFNEQLYAQNVGIGTLSPHNSAKLHIEDANRGILIPRLSIPNLSAAAPVTAPVTSLLVYNTNTTTGVGFYYWDGSAWNRLNDQTTSDHDWYGVGTVTAPNDINDNIFTQGRVGIGTSNPLHTLDVRGDVAINRNEISGGNRPWMVDGIRIGAGGSDNAYFGLKDEGANDADAVIVWGDDAGDHLRFIKTNSGGPVDGEEYMRITDNGNVGVGITTPTYGLVVANSKTTNTGAAYISAALNNSGKGLFIDGKTRQSSEVNIPLLQIDAGIAGSNATAFWVNTSGNTGIGTATPSELLELNNGGMQINQSFGIGFGGEIPANGNVVTDAAKIYLDPSLLGTGGTTNDALVIEKTDINDLNPDGGIAFVMKGSDNIRETTMVLRGTGNVGIGTNNPSQRLEVCGNAKIVGQIQANSSNLTAGLTCSSDQRLKINITSYTNALATIQLLKGKQYNWRHQEFTDRGFDERIKYGFIAQEVEKVLPSLVYEDAKGFKSVDYIQVIPILTNAIQEQQTELRAVKEENKVLQEELAAIKAEQQLIKAEVSNLSAMQAELDQLKELLHTKAQK